MSGGWFFVAPSGGLDGVDDQNPRFHRGLLSAAPPALTGRAPGLPTAKRKLPVDDSDFADEPPANSGAGFSKRRRTILPLRQRELGERAGVRWHVKPISHSGGAAAPPYQ